MLAWLAGPPPFDDFVEALRDLGVPQSQLPQQPEREKPELWDCNAVAMDVFRRMPWVHGPKGPVALQWLCLDAVLSEVPHAKKRRNKRELPELLRQAESWVIEELQERRSKQPKTQ